MSDAAEMVEMVEMVIVTAAIAPLNAEPRAGSEQVSQRLAGHALLLLEERAPWLRVRGDDDYEGWVHRGYVQSASTIHSSSPGRMSLGCVVRAADGLARPLPLGAAIDARATLLSGGAVDRDGLAERFQRNAHAIVRSAVELFAGTPYQWGGITPWGADCSGLVQSCFGLHGIRVPRDASQQALLGGSIDGDLRSLAPADLLFFSDRAEGRITHVGIAMGEMRMVHLAIGRGGYAVERLGDASDPYVAALVGRFRFARRLAI